MEAYAKHRPERDEHCYEFAFQLRPSKDADERADREKDDDDER